MGKEITAQEIYFIPSTLEEKLGLPNSMAFPKGHLTLVAGTPESFQRVLETVVSHPKNKGLKVGYIGLDLLSLPSPLPENWEVLLPEGGGYGPDLLPLVKEGDPDPAIGTLKAIISSVYHSRYDLILFEAGRSPKSLIEFVCIRQWTQNLPILLKYLKGSKTSCVGFTSRKSLNTAFEFYSSRVWEVRPKTPGEKEFLFRVLRDKCSSEPLHLDHYPETAFYLLPGGEVRRLEEE